MKIRIEFDETVQEPEVVIRCRELSEEIAEVQRVISNCSVKGQKFSFYQGDVEYFLSMNEVLFFETGTDGISAHTSNNVYSVKYRLYELEKLLPNYFLRVSKSTILNVRQIYSIEKNLTASSLVKFQNSHK